MQRVIALSDRIARRVSPWTLALAVLVFALPFVSVSCVTPAGFGSAGGGVTAKYSGLTLAIGGTPALDAPENLPRPGPPKADDVVPFQPFFAIALVLVALALLATLAVIARHALVVFVLAVTAGASSVAGLSEVDRWLTDRIVAALVRQSNPRLASTDPATYVTADVGLLLLLLLLALTAVLNGVALIRGRDERGS